MASRASEQKTALNLIKDILYARRNGNIMREQRAHERLQSFCLNHNYDFSDTLNGGIRYLKTHDAAAILNSIV